MLLALCRAAEQEARRAKQERDFDALINELLRAWSDDPPLANGDARRLRIEGRP